jgi:hypothetical protein
MALYWTIVGDAVLPTTVIGVFVFCGLYDVQKPQIQSPIRNSSGAAVVPGVPSSTALSVQHPQFDHSPHTRGSGRSRACNGKLAALLRYSLDATARSTVRLEQELKMATDYLEIEKTRFGERLSYTIDVPKH